MRSFDSVVFGAGRAQVVVRGFASSAFGWDWAELPVIEETVRLRTSC